MKKSERRHALQLLVDLPRHAPTPDDAGPELLRSLLLARARAAYLPPSEPWPEDAEALVHDVRVASRRLVEALALVRPMLPRKVHARLVRDARRLRRALGVRREADVMLGGLARWATAAEIPDDVLAELVTGLSRRAEASLAEARAFYDRERLHRAAARVVRGCAATARSATWREVGGPHLYGRAVAPEARLEQLTDPMAMDDHHALRVDFKRLRYTVEILAEPFPEALDAPHLLPRLKELQDALGVLQDAADGVRFCARADVRAAVGADAQARLGELAERERRTRHEAARARVGALAPDLLGRLRRAAGRIGPIVPWPRHGP